MPEKPNEAMPEGCFSFPCGCAFCAIPSCDRRMDGEMPGGGQQKEE